MFKIVVKVEGLKCPNCEKHANEAVKEAFSVKKVASSHADNEMVIVSKENLNDEKLIAVIEEAGYQVTDIAREEYKSFFGK